MTDTTYKINIENVFEGPMDLLIHLIKKNEVDIYDIPIALITRQYLGYLELMRALNIDFAGDFLIMAATLAQIKSKMLLPVHDNEEGEDDPRMEIARPLLEYLQIKDAADKLAERPLLGDATFTRPALKNAFEISRGEETIQVGLFELIDAFQKILDKVSEQDAVSFSADRISVRERISELVNLLEAKGSLTFDELFEGHATRSEVITTFLAVLEMAKMCLVRIAQHLQSGIIRIFYL